MFVLFVNNNLREENLRNGFMFSIYVKYHKILFDVNVCETVLL